MSNIGIKLRPISCGTCLYWDNFSGVCFCGARMEGEA